MLFIIAQDFRAPSRNIRISRARRLAAVPALPDERAARSVISAAFPPLSAWKALLSAAMVTGYEVPGK